MKGERAVILLYLAGLHQHQVGDIAAVQRQVRHLPALHQAADGSSGCVDSWSDSGYIHLRGDKTAFNASHAWAEAWVAGRGWVGFDATHPVRTTPHHVRLAVGRDYTDAAPTRGIYVGSANSTMMISVKTRAVG